MSYAWAEAEKPDEVYDFAFSTERAKWEPIEFSERTPSEYWFDTSTESLCARSDASASAYGREVDVDLEKTPILEWEWQVIDSFQTEGPLRKETDDYPARVYVNYSDSESLSWWQKLKKNAVESYYGRSIPDQSLNFVWADQIEKEKIVKSPYTDRVRLKALRDENDELGRWYREQLNLRSLYREAFDREMIPTVNSIAVMTDTDNTEKTARACYRNFAFTPAGDTA
jgi:hypothetical protein